MNKKFRIYWNNLVRQEFFFLDIINLILGTVALVCAVFAMLQGSLMMHMLVFLLGGTLMLLNMVKNIKRKSMLAITFGVFTVVLYSLCAFVLYRMLLAG